jgi:hypothetical protein
MAQDIFGSHAGRNIAAHVSTIGAQSGFLTDDYLKSVTKVNFVATSAL